jgi:pyruvate dehydrogenase E2 component (dihydrolipoamide acetyltransferase)
MAERLLMLALSPTMTEGRIARWKVAEGEAFKAGAVLCEVETDKASMDYEASKGAVLLKILLPEGGSAAVGEPIAVVGAAGGAAPMPPELGAIGAVGRAGAGGGAALGGAGSAAFASVAARGPGSSPAAPTTAMGSPTAARPPSGRRILRRTAPFAAS